VDQVGTVVEDRLVEEGDRPVATEPRERLETAVRGAGPELQVRQVHAVDRGSLVADDGMHPSDIVSLHPIP
jgi:hypothetical protein